MSYQPAGYAPAPYQPAGATIIGEPDNQAHTIIAWIAALGSLLIMLPWAIAASRHTKNAPLIGLINFLFCWTGIGWIACLVWACTDKHKNAHLQLPVVVAPMILAPPPYGYAPQTYPQPPHQSQQHQPQFQQPHFGPPRPGQYPQPGAYAALPPGAQPSADPYADTQVIDATAIQPDYR